MRIKLQARQTGKTHDIIHELKKDKDAIMLVHCLMRKDQLLRDYNFLETNRIFSFPNVVRHPEILRGRNISVVYIDEIGLCIQMLFPVLPIGYATHTN